MSDRAPWRWRTEGAWPDEPVRDFPRLRSRPARVAREALQQATLFPLTRAVARPRVIGADDLLHTPQPAVIASNHASDIDTPLILGALPRTWRMRTVVAAAEDRFYRRWGYAAMTAAWINTFPFDRAATLRGLADAVRHLDDGWNVLFYPQATRSHGRLEGFRHGVGRVCVSGGVPLVPVHVRGTSLIMPRNRGLIQRGQATVRFGVPLSAEPDEDAPAFTARAAAAIAALASTSA